MMIPPMEHDDAAEHRETLGAIGLLLIAAGELALCCITMRPPSPPEGAPVDASGPLGLVLAMAAGLQAYVPLRHPDMPGRAAQAIAAAGYAAAGAWLLFSRTLDAGGMLAWLGAFFLATAALQIYAATAAQRALWGWIVLSGCATAVIGLAMVSGQLAPVIGSIGLLAALELFVAGCTWLGLAWHGHAAAGKAQAAAPLDAAA